MSPSIQKQSQSLKVPNALKRTFKSFIVSHTYTLFIDCHLHICMLTTTTVHHHCYSRNITHPHSLPKSIRLLISRGQEVCCCCWEISASTHTCSPDDWLVTLRSLVDFAPISLPCSLSLFDWSHLPPRSPILNHRCLNINSHHLLSKSTVPNYRINYSPLHFHVVSPLSPPPPSFLLLLHLLHLLLLFFSIHHFILSYNILLTHIHHLFIFPL